MKKYRPSYISLKKSSLPPLSGWHIRQRLLEILFTVSGGASSDNNKKSQRLVGAENGLCASCRRRFFPSCFFCKSFCFKVSVKLLPLPLAFRVILFVLALQRVPLYFENFQLKPATAPSICRSLSIPLLTSI